MRILRWWVPVVLVLAGCAPAPAASTLPVASSSAPEATPTVSPTGSLATPSATPINASLIDELVAVVTEDLVVRSQPGTGSDSEIYMGRLNAPDMVYVIAGPERADGYDWYLVDPVREPCFLGCDFEPQPGWVAAASTDGERWLGQESERPDCPAAPTTDDLISLLEELRLYCYGGQELTLQGYAIESSEAPPQWPWEYFNRLYSSDYSPPAPGCQDACDLPSFRLVHDSAVGLHQPGATRITGHFDDPDAQSCQPLGSNVDPRLGTHECRLLFVVTSGW